MKSGSGPIFPQTAILRAAASGMSAACVMALLLAGPAACRAQQRLVGAAAGNFTLKDVKGKQVSLSDFKGRTVLLNFWATWCSPCNEELPAIQRIYEHHKDARNVVILAVDDQNKATIRNFMQEKHYTFTALLDHKRTLFKKFNVRFIPTVIIINKQGTITGEIVGWHGPQKLLAALKQSAQ